MVKVVEIKGEGMDWQAIRYHALRWYSGIAQLYLFLAICLWLLGCVVGHTAIGPSKYVQFVDHVFKWEAYERQVSIAKANTRER